MAVAFQTIAGNTGSDGSAEVTLPSGLSAGDLMIATVHSGSSAGTSPTHVHSWPAGWTVVENRGGAAGSSNSGWFSVAWRAWQSGDSAPTVTIPSVSSSGWVSTCARYSGCSTTAPFYTDAGIWEQRSTANSNPIAAPSVTGPSSSFVVAVHSGLQTDARTWGSQTVATSERIDQASSGLTIDLSAAWSDSNGDIDTSSGVAPQATPSDTLASAAAWVGVLSEPGDPAIAFESVATNTGTDTSAEVTLPSGLADGDIMVAAVHNHTTVDNAGTHTWPGGWTVVHNISAPTGSSTIGGSLSVAWRAWQSGDSAPSVTVPDVTSGGWVAICNRYSGVDTTTPFADEDGAEEARNPSTSAAMAAPTITGGSTGWVVYTASGAQLATRTWSSYAGGVEIERADLATAGPPTVETCTCWADSGSSVNTSGGVAPSGTPSGTITVAMAWAGVLQEASAGTSAPAETTTQTGTANAAVAGHGNLAGSVSATATANNTAFDYAPAGEVSATAAANDATVETGIDALAGEVSASVVANAATVDADDTLGLAEGVSASGAANSPVAGLGALAGAVTGSVTAEDATVRIGLNAFAETVTATGVTNSPVTNFGALSGTASGTATASDTAFDYAPAEHVTAAVSVAGAHLALGAPAGAAAAVSVVANNATVDADDTLGLAESVVAVSVVESPLAGVGATPGVASAVTSVANDATVDFSITAEAELASVQVAAENVKGGLGALAGAVAPSVVANDATVSTEAHTNANAEAVAGTAVANDTAFDYAPAETVSATVVANDAEADNRSYATMDDDVEVSVSAFNATVDADDILGLAEEVAVSTSVASPLAGAGGLPQAVVVSVIAGDATVDFAVTAEAGEVAATATSNSPQTSVGALASDAAATVVANSATVSTGTQAPSGTASASVSATDSAVATGALPSSATGAGAAAQPYVSAVQTVTGTGTAFDPTVDAQSAQEADAESVQISAVAFGASVAVTTAAGTVTATVTAGAGTSSFGALAQAVSVACVAIGDSDMVENFVGTTAGVGSISVTANGATTNLQFEAPGRTLSPEAEDRTYAPVVEARIFYVTSDGRTHVVARETRTVYAGVEAKNA